MNYVSSMRNLSQINTFYSLILEKFKRVKIFRQRFNISLCPQLEIQF